MNNENKILGENIKRLRKKHGLTQEEFAEKLGITGKAVSKWENGNTYPHRSTIMRISRTFNVRMDDLENGYLPEDVSQDTNIVEIYNFMNEINKKLGSMMKQRNIVDDYLAEASKNEMCYAPYEFANTEPLTEEEMEFNDLKQFYVMEIHKLMSDLEFEEALEYCDELIGKGFGEMASIAIDVCEESLKYFAVEEMDLYGERIELRRKYVQIYIHSLMQQYGLTKADFI